MKPEQQSEMRHERVDSVIHRLEEEVATYEKRFQQSSQDYFKAVRIGKARETPEVSKWMNSYRVLHVLLRAGRTTGTP